METTPTIVSALLGALVVLVASTAGALPMRFFSGLGRRASSALLGGSAGVMLGASVFSLLLPALDLFRKQELSPLDSAVRVGLGLLAGALFLHVFHGLLPHEHLMKGREGAPPSSTRSRQWLIVMAIALHNLPEGLAVGVGLGSGDGALSLSLTSAIAFQDLPEGFVVAIGLHALGLNFWKVLGITALTGVVEALGVLGGFGFVSLARATLPLSLAMCAGAMLFVVSREMIPESHREGTEDIATAGVLLGFVLMMLMDFGLA